MTGELRSMKSVRETFRRGKRADSLICSTNAAGVRLLLYARAGGAAMNGAALTDSFLRAIGGGLSLEFAVEYPCALRARYTEEHLRAWGRLSSLHTRLTTGESIAPSHEKVRFVERA